MNDAFDAILNTPDAPTGGGGNGQSFDDLLNTPDYNPNAAAPSAAAPSAAPGGGGGNQTQHKFRAPAPASPWRAAGAAPQQQAAKTAPGAPPPPPQADWSKETAQEVASHIGQNFLPSLKATGQSFMDSVTHPLETLETLGNVAGGVGAQVGRKMGIQQDANAQKNMKLAKAIESHYGNIYMPVFHGDFRPLENAVETDPTGTALDWSTLVGMPGGVLKGMATGAKLASGAAKAAKLGTTAVGIAKGTGLAGGLANVAEGLGKAGNVASTVGKIADPLTYATAPLWAAGKAAGAATRGISAAATGVDRAAFEAATAAGKSPLSAPSRSFLGNMVKPNAIKNAQKIGDAIDTVEKQSINSTRAAKAALKGTEPSYDPIYKAIQSVRDDDLGGTATKQAGLLAPAHDALDDLEASVRQYQAANPGGFGGMDMLRKSINDAAERTSNSTAKAALYKVYHDGAVQSLRNAFPGYQDVSTAAKAGMQNVRDLTKGLGAGDNSTTAQTIRRASKAATTSDGTDLLGRLDKVDPTISPSLHGMSLNKVSSHNAINYGLTFLNPAAAAKAYTLSSPILNGAAHYVAGMGQGVGRNAVNLGRVGSTLGRVNDAETPVVAADGSPAPDPATGDVANAVMRTEGTGRNPISSATGPGQFITGTFVDSVKKYHPEIAQGLSDKQIAALHGTPQGDALQADMSPKLDRDNASMLQTQGISPTPGRIKLAHMLGPSGVRRFFSAHDMNAPAEQYISPDAVAANASVFRGKTVGEVEQWAEGLMQRASRPGPARGGSVGHEHLVNRLMARAKNAKREADKITEPLMRAPDAAIAKALDVAQEAI